MTIMGLFRTHPEAKETTMVMIVERDAPIWCGTFFDLFCSTEREEYKEIATQRQVLYYDMRDNNMMIKLD